MTTENQTPAVAGDLQAADNLKAQIEQFTNFNQELVGGGSIKKIMGEVHAKSADLWQVPPEEIVVLAGYNPRVHNRAYYDGIELLAKNMARDGYMQDKPLAVYIAKIDGVDRMVAQDGHRRHAAVMLAKTTLGAPIKTVPVVVKPKSDNAVDLLKAMLHANEATPFTVYEKAVIAKRFKSFGWPDKDIAAEMHCTPAFVGQLLSMAGAPEQIQQLVNQGELSATAAMEIVRDHGENAVAVATEAVKTAKAAGKKSATMKDVASPKDQKTKNAKRVSYELYFNLKKLREDPAIEKKIDDKMIETIDALLAIVEKQKKVRAPVAAKPAKAAKPAAAKKAPAAKKTAAKKTTGKKLAAWDLAKGAQA